MRMPIASPVTSSARVSGPRTCCWRPSASALTPASRSGRKRRSTAARPPAKDTIPAGAAATSQVTQSKRSRSAGGRSSRTKKFVAMPVRKILLKYQYPTSPANARPALPLLRGG